MSRARTWLLWLLAITLLASVALAISRVAKRGRFSSAYSSYGAGPDGTRALFRLVQELGYDARRLARELSQLEQGTLVAIGGCRGGLSRPLARPEREALAEWVERGGLLIVAGVPEYLPETSGLVADLPPTCRDEENENWLERVLASDDKPLSSEPKVPRSSEVIPSGPPLAHVLPFVADRAGTVRVLSDHEATGILESESGALGLTAPFGRGRVVLLGVPEALTNRDLSSGGAVVFARLLEAFAPKGPVWFDEYHLGLGERRSLIRYLRDRGYGTALLQFVLILLAAFGASAVRLGDAREVPNAPVRSSLKYLSALASLYARSGDQKGALELLSRRALRRIARHYRADSVPLVDLPGWLHSVGLGAVALYAQRVSEHAARPLARGESLNSRALEIDRDATAAIVIGDAS